MHHHLHQWLALQELYMSSPPNERVEVSISEVGKYDGLLLIINFKVDVESVHYSGFNVL